MTEAQKGLLTSKELGMAVADRLRQSEKQPKAPSTEQTDKQQPHLRRPIMPPPTKEQRVGREAAHNVQYSKDKSTSLTDQLQHQPETAASEPATAITEHTAAPAKKPEIDEAYPWFSTPEQQAQYRKLQECVLPFTEEEVKQWQARWDSPEGIAERKRLDEKYKKPLTREEWDKLLAPHMKDAQGNWKVPLPKWIRRWDAQGREQRWQTPRDKELIAYYNYLATLSPEEHIIMWEVNQERMRAGLPSLRTIEEVSLWQTLQRLMKDIVPPDETQHEEKFSWWEWLANIASAMVDALVAGASVEDAETIAHSQYPEKVK